MPEDKKDKKIKTKINPKIVKEFEQEGIPMGYDSPEEYFNDFYGPMLKEGGMTKSKKKSNEDPYTSRNEFKKGFYDQSDKPPVTEDTMYGIRKNTEPTYEVSPDSMNYSHGGSITVKTKLGKIKPTKLY
jgi:hypothetical protein